MLAAEIDERDLFELMLLHEGDIEKLRLNQYFSCNFIQNEKPISQGSRFARTLTTELVKE